MQTDQLKRRWRQLTAAALAAVFLSGCGFALRGSNVVPDSLQPLYVAGKDQSQELAQSLRRQLQINNIAVVEHRSKARLIVEVRLLMPEKRSIALDHEARDAEYALFERTAVSLFDASNQLLRGPRILEQRRLIVNDTDNPVGEETESSIVRDEMRAQLSIQIARQVEYWAQHLAGQTP